MDSITGRHGVGSLVLMAALGYLAQTVWVSKAHADMVQDWIRSFAESEIEFQRGSTNVPFVPLAFIDVTHYDDIELQRGNGSVLSVNQQTISQGAALPLLLGPRDVLVVGEWLSRSQFDSRSSALQSFHVDSAGIPVGWLRQVNRSWQTAAFVMPLGYKASLANASWRWEYLGGAFARYVQRDDLWWAFGVFADVGPDDDTYLPYAGVSWDITDQWTLSAIMPWPAVLYAPDRDTLVRLGASPSGAAWSLGSGADKVGYELASWDLGVTAEHRMTGNFWVGLKAGVGGLRTLRMTGSDWIGPEMDLGSSPYIGLGISYRPELLD